MPKRTNNEPFSYNITEGWKVVQATGQQMKKQVKKVLFNNLMTLSGSMMKPRMPGMPGISKADAD